MKKNRRLLLIILVAIFIVIQFFQPEKNLGEIDSKHLFNQVDLTPALRQTLQNSCMDCHSNQTRYLWYDNIAPASWMVKSHITEGKKSLNFSEWEKFSNFDKIDALDNISGNVKKGKMPLKSYTMIHKNARLTEADVDSICSWADKLADTLAANEK